MNDSRALDFSRPAAPSGTHWSLVAYERAADTFFHLDSLGANSAAARALVAKLRRLLGVRAAFAEPPAPQQHNSYDCGTSRTRKPPPRGAPGPPLTRATFRLP